MPRSKTAREVERQRRGAFNAVDSVLARRVHANAVYLQAKMPLERAAAPFHFRILGLLYALVT
jgi:hypothetical protein